MLLHYQRQVNGNRKPKNLVIIGNYLCVVMNLMPAGSRNVYYNYKNFFSIVLMACVDANYMFMSAEVGSKGSLSKGGF